MNIVQVILAGFVKGETGDAISDLQNALTGLVNAITQGWQNFTYAVEQRLQTSDELFNNTANLARTLGHYAGQLQNEVTQ